MLESNPGKFIPDITAVIAKWRNFFGIPFFVASPSEASLYIIARDFSNPSCAGEAAEAA